MSLPRNVVQDTAAETLETDPMSPNPTDADLDTPPESPLDGFNQTERRHMEYLIALARHLMNDATQITITNRMAATPRYTWFRRAVDTKSFQDYKDEVATLVSKLPWQLLELGHSISDEDIAALSRAYPQMRMLYDFAIFTKGAPRIWRFGDSERKALRTLKRLYRRTIFDTI